MLLVELVLEYEVTLDLLEVEVSVYHGYHGLKFQVYSFIISFHSVAGEQLVGKTTRRSSNRR